MPQFDFATFTPQLVWLAITFGFLYFVMSRYALPRVGEILEERQNRIEGDLEKAEKLKTESQKLEEEYAIQVASAKAEAAAHLKAEREKIQAKMEEKRSHMMTEVEAKIAAAEARIAEAKGKAMKDVEGIAISVCKAIVAQLSSQKLTDAAAKKAIAAQTGKDA